MQFNIHELNKRQKINILITLGILLLITTLIVSLTNSKKYDPTEVKFEVTYNPIFENQIYPSLILGLAHYVPNESELNDTISLFRVRATAPCDNAVLTLVIDSTPLSNTTKIQEIMRDKGERYSFYPIIKWKYDKLYRARRHGVLDLTVHCLINNEEVDVKNLRLSYRSANECLLSLTDSTGHSYSFRWMFTAYVNEEHPYIDSILTTMLSQGITHRIVGYQSGRAEVVKQVEAIWYYALEHGISYSSISTTSTPTKHANVQHVRFFEDVYTMRQANCIDACVFFASVIRKIGLKPVIFVLPNHAFLGYYTDRNRKNIKLLETTMTQWADLLELTNAYNQTMQLNPEAQGTDRLPADIWAHYSRYLTPAQRTRWKNNTMTLQQLKYAISHYLFTKASEYNIQSYNNHKKDFNNMENYQYQMFDIEYFRKAVQPIVGDY